MSKIYTDKWGDRWKQINSFYVQRLSDGNIGLWMNGEGLK